MKLFSPFRLREIELKNRIVVSPMCEYSAKDGHPQAWHLVHLGSRAIGGASLVFTEATAVEARGRISAVRHGDLRRCACRILAADRGVYSDTRGGAGNAVRACREESEHGATLDWRQAGCAARWRLAAGWAERVGV